MIGGPTDILVEANIVRVRAAASGHRRWLIISPGVLAGAPGEDLNWPSLQPEPPSLHGPRRCRARLSLEDSSQWALQPNNPRRLPCRSARVRSDPLAGLAAELSSVRPSEPVAPASRDSAPAPRTVESARARESSCGDAAHGGQAGSDASRQPQPYRSNPPIRTSPTWREAPRSGAPPPGRTMGWRRHHAHGVAQSGLAQPGPRAEAPRAAPAWSRLQRRLATPAKAPEVISPAAAAPEKPKEAPVAAPAAAKPAPAPAKAAPEKSDKPDDVFGSLEEEMANLLGSAGRQAVLTQTIACCVRLLTVAAIFAVLPDTAFSQDISINFWTRRRIDRARDPDDRADHGAVAGAVDPRDDDLVHADRRGSVVAAHRAWVPAQRRRIRCWSRWRCS